jgi:4-diphosphocytidyl-2-C-methyl-D-erythritol kinase
MIYYSPCKINIGLHVFNKRTDGFHNLDSLMYPIAWFDVLEIIPSDKLKFSFSGLKIPGKIDDNLCVKAYELLKKDFSIPNCSIHLHKMIPMGAGIGGGSANAAVVLKGLNEVFKLRLSNFQLKEYASYLGSDCAFFVDSVPQIATGRGEQLVQSTFSLKGYWIKLVNIGIHISTKDAFQNVSFVENKKTIKTILDNTPIEKLGLEIENSFEPFAFRIHPKLKEIKEQLIKEGAVYAAMSGSGSTIYGIFKQEPIPSFNLNKPTFFEKILRLEF